MVVFSSCKKNEDELVLNVKNEYIFFNKQRGKDINTILNYSIKNNSNKKYCFFINPESELIFDKKCVHLDNIFLSLISMKDSAFVSSRLINYNSNNCQHEYINNLNSYYKSMGYEATDGCSMEKIKRSVIFINPKQEIFFETLIKSEDSNVFNERITIDKEKKYEASFFTYSDSTNYKKIISRNDLKTMQVNGFKMFHGIIQSKQKVKLKVLN